MTDLTVALILPLSVCLQLHYNSKMLKMDSPNASRGSSLPRTLSKESKLYGMRDAPAPPVSGPGKTNTLLPPPPPPPPSGIHSLHVSSFAAGFLHALMCSVTGAYTSELGCSAWLSLISVHSCHSAGSFFRCGSVVFTADVPLLGLSQASIISCYYNIIGNNFILLIFFFSVCSLSLVYLADIKLEKKSVYTLPFKCLKSGHFFFFNFC